MSTITKRTLVIKSGHMVRVIVCLLEYASNERHERIVLLDILIGYFYDYVIRNTNIIIYQRVS